MNKYDLNVMLIAFALLLCISLMGSVSAAAPDANFTSNVTSGVENLTVQFNDTTTGNPTSWTWDFGDGSTSTDENPTHTYTAGNYTVTLTATNNNGSSTMSKYILVYDITGANKFTNPSFEDGTNNWTIGTNTNTSTSMAHTGNTSIYFSTTGNKLTNYVTQNIDLSLVDSISFWGYGATTTPANYFYIYIDGISVKFFKVIAGTWTQYSYVLSGYTGMHNVTILTLTQGCAAYVDDFNVSITKNQANFTENTTNSPTEPLTVQFNDTSIGLITGWAWDFNGDGITDSNQRNPTYTYNTPGTYTVTLTVTGPYYTSTKTLTNFFTVTGPTNNRTGTIYTTIQEAIDNALNGDTILTGNTSYRETYTENLNINKNVTLTAIGNVIIKALNSNKPTITILGSGSGTVINGFTITGATNSTAIYIAPLTTATIINNTITGNNVGINNMGNSTVIGNIISNNIVGINNIENITITQNTIKDNSIGIAAYGTSNIHLNNIYNNTEYGLKFTGNSVNASNNWWGTNNPTYINGITTTTTKADIYEAQNTNQTVYDPWIVLNVTVSDDLLKNGDNSTITADMTHNSNGDNTSSSGTIPDLPVNFNYTLGTLNTNTTIVTRGKATVILTGGNTSGTQNLAATVTGCTVTTSITVDTIAPNATTSLTGGTFNNTQNVTLTTNDPTAIIYYTTDTTDPRTSTTRTQYTGPITINTTITLRYAAIDPAGNWSPLYIQNYLIGENGLADSDWPSFQHDGNNSGQSNNTGPQTNSTEWTFNGLTVYGSAVIGSDGTIYVASYEGILYAFNSKGVLQWTWTTRSYILGSPVIGSDGTIYITNWMNSTTYAISANGTLIWKYTTGDYSTSSPVISADGTIYVTTTNSTNSILYALNPTGTLKWTCTLGSVYGNSPVIGSDGTLYITDSNGIFYAINTDGTVQWTYNLKGSTLYNTASIGSDGTIYIGTKTGDLYAINPKGTVKWKYSIGESIYGTPSISKDGTIYVVGSSNLYALKDNGTNVTVKWTYPTGGINGTSSTSATIDNDGTIYIGSNTGLYALIDNGNIATLKWSYLTGSIAGSPAISSDGSLYIGTTSGTFYAFNNRAVNFNITRVNGTALTVQFDASSTVTPVTSWKWYFGDNSTSTEQNPTHTYAKAGYYTIGLVANLADGSVIVRPSIVYIEELDITAPTVNTSLPSGTYVNLQNVTLTATDDRNPTTIYYTSDGSDPVTSSSRQVYTGPITLYDSTTIKFAAVDSSGNWSPVSNATYTILHVVYVEDASSYNATTMNTEIQNILDTIPEGYIVVFKGTEYNNLQLVINKQLTILSTIGTRIVTSSPGNAVFLINGTQSSGTQIIGFTILTNTTNGILINNTNNVTVYNVQVISDDGTGVMVNNSSDVVITYVTVTDSVTGVQVSGSNNTQIIDCIITGNINGVDIENSTNTIVYGGNISNNVESGVQIINSSNNTIYGVTIKGNGLNGSNTRSGVYLNNTTNTLISTCQITENWYGIYTKDTHTTTITTSYINTNELDGIILTGTIVDTTISSNMLDGNMNGIHINGAYDNLLIETNIITNSNLTKHEEISYEYRGQGIVFGYYSNGAESILVNHNIIVGNGHRDIETRYGPTPTINNGANPHFPGSNWLDNYCCADIYDAQMEMRITRIGDGTYIVQFFDGVTGKLISGFLPFAVTFDSGYSVTTAMYSDSQAIMTVSPNQIKDAMKASAFGRSTTSSLYNTIGDYSQKKEQLTASGMGDGLGDEFGTGINSKGPGSGNRPGFATTTGTSGSSGSGSTTGALALGAAAAASTSGASSMGSPQGSGLSAIGKKIQELIANELKNHSQLWGIIAIIVLLVVVILAYYRKSIKSMIEKSKK